MKEAWLYVKPLRNCKHLLKLCNGKPWKPKSKEGTGPSGPVGKADSRSGGTSSTADKEAGKDRVVQNRLLEYPSLGEVQHRRVHSNTRSLMMICGRRGEAQKGSQMADFKAACR